MNLIITTTLLLTLVLSVLTLAGQPSMNGIKLSDYADFEKKWHLVTVRYRKDTGEQRFIYANELAWQTLEKKVTDYPDGAVFAKIGLATQEDEMFVSSLEPSGTRRYQLMVRDKKRYKDADGWGYALFDANGSTFDEDLKTRTQSCVACHRVAKERGYVFARPMQLRVGESELIKVNHKQKYSTIQFKTIQKENLPAQIAKHIPSQINNIDVLEGEIAKNLFQGTIDEIRPTLASQAKKSQGAALMMNEQKDQFSLVYILEDRQRCANLDGNPNTRFFKAIYTTTPREKAPIPVESVMTKDFCF